MHSPLRNAVRATALSTPLVLALAVPATAWATPPVTWEDPPPMSMLHALLLFGGVPLGLVVLIALLTVAPSVARGSAPQRGVDRWATPQWFNGPRAESLAEARESQPVGAGAGAPRPLAAGAGVPRTLTVGTHEVPGTGAHAARGAVVAAAAPGGGASARW